MAAMTNDVPGPVCLNCGSSLHGQFCSRCGQEAVSDPSLRRWLGDLAEDLFNLDSRAWRTVRTLMIAPGRLSEEYRAGRRARWVAPMRLYLITSLLVFAAMEFAPVPIARITQTPPGGAVGTPPTAPSAPQVPPDTAAAHADVAPAGSEPGGTEPELMLRRRAGQFWGERIQRAAAHPSPDQLNRLWVRGTTWMMFVLIPVFAFLLRLACGLPRMLYLYHLVFALHVHAFTFLLMAAALLLTHPLAPLGENVMREPFRIAFLVSGGYTVLAARRFYAASVAGTMLRVGLVGMGYLLICAAGALIVLGAVVLLLS